ncbi:LysE family translocator [Pseudoalteromonas phenolica]|uniref:Translocator protein, LysE family n=1 Tax=Pseudoalteromonas phenolica TaxID=161398 RepID=A0A0S2K2Q2_9GAMM|nr:LysE family translocator [Pseudoalteromonas phenolica]ALO42505.1 Translocator protein, LysE family [Pseudoalteromonas phenolica]MBE0356395.1 hypothetical protein [Pseudoalteromonas phenolica O-BC30]
MLIDYTLILLYVSSIVVFLGTPGPVAVLVANSSVNGGISAGMKTIIGTNLASIILISVSFLMINGIFSANDHALSFLTFFGALYLIYFSIDTLKSKVNLSKESVDKNKSKSWLRSGFLIGISNPKDILFFIAFFPAFFNVTDNKTASMFLLLTIWVILDYALLFLLSFFFTKVSKENTANKINKCSGSILLLIACFALYTSAPEVFQVLA